MKLIIDISEKYIKTVQHRNPLSLSAITEVERAIAVGTPIPDNATNGDVIKAIFPTYKYKEGARFVSVVNDNKIIEIWNTCWNAPYKAESEVQE